MSDRIVVDTDKLAWCVRELKNLTDKTGGAANQLRRIDFTNCGSGDMHVSGTATLKCSGRRITGGTVPAMLDAYASGLKDVGDSTTRLAQTVQIVWERFVAAEEEIKRLVEGEKDGLSLAAYEAPFPAGTTDEQLEKIHKAEWEGQDSFIGTAYDEKLKELLQDLILTHPSFSEEAWDECKTLEEKQTFLRGLMDEIHLAMGTELKNGFYITDADTETDATVTIMVDGKPESTSFLAYWGGVYKTDYDAIIIRVSPGDSLYDVIGTMCHENRHNLQHEMVNTKDLRNSKYVLSEDEYSAVASEVADWNDELNEDGYYLYTADQVYRRQEEIVKELPWTDKLSLSKYDEYNLALDYANIEFRVPYLANAVEVDARYMEDYARRCQRIRNRNDRNAQIKETLTPVADGYVAYHSMPWKAAGAIAQAMFNPEDRQ